jgi:hypothetical protein
LAFGRDDPAVSVVDMRCLILSLVLLASCAKKADHRSECDDLYGQHLKRLSSLDIKPATDRKAEYIEACMKIPADVVHCESSDDTSDRCEKLLHNRGNQGYLIDLEMILH